jgi:predicted HNH restriction endonuclease
MADWSQQELELVVSIYLNMLEAYLREEKVNRARLTRELLKRLDGKTKRNVDYIYENVSAVLRDAGKKGIRGYRPTRTTRNDLRDMVLRLLDTRGLELPDSDETFVEIPEEITRSHILSGIKDFNDGRPHQFKPSTFYDLLYEGRRYPPKAILGLAAAQILGEPMRPEHFSGGLHSACFRILNEQGFVIVPKEGRGFSGAWIFQGNPKRFDIDAYITEFDYVYWSAPQHKENVQIGDTVYIWRAGSDAGIVAIGEVAESATSVDKVKHPSVLAGDLWTEPPEDSHSLKVGISLSEKRLTEEEAMVSRGSLINHPTLAVASIVRMPQQTVFQLTKEQAMALFHLWATQNSTSIEVGHSEGSVRLRQHYSRERSRKLREHKKADYLRTNPRLNCEVCGFTFNENYPPDLAGDYIEVHHIIPLSELQEQTRTTLDDLLLVCSNCHRMIHRTRDAESNLNQLRQHFQLKNA